MSKISQTIDHLITKGEIPVSGLFDITENLLYSYITTYGNLFGQSTNFCDKSLSRKLAGLNLLKLKLKERQGTYLNCEEGILYLICNNAWPGYYKIGITTDIDNRLSVYQTGDPHRGYKIRHYEFVLNRKLAEKQVLAAYKVDLSSGEWLKDIDAMDMINQLRKQWNIPQGNYNGVVAQRKSKMLLTSRSRFRNSPALPKIGVD